MIELTAQKSQFMYILDYYLSDDFFLFAKILLEQRQYRKYK